LVQKRILRAADFWDANREKVKDPAFWMAHPLCRAAINRRVTGSADEWPLNWFQRLYGQKPFSRGVSWGCGLGAFERWAIKLGLVREIDAFDISPVSLEDARRVAEEDGLSGIHYKLGSFDRPELSDRAYDVVFFHASLHHVSNLEGLFETLSRALVPGGAIYLDDYVGRSRHLWRKRHLRLAQDVLDTLPAEAKLHQRLDFPVERDDPSEAVRSGEIVSFLREYFDLVEFKPYGGQIVALVLPFVAPDWMSSEQGQKQLQNMLEIEERQIRQNPSSSGYLVAYGTLKPGRAYGRKRDAGVRRRLKNLGRAGARLAFLVYWLFFKISRRLRARGLRHAS